MRYIIIERYDAYLKFEIDKSHLAKVKSGDFEMIIDTEEGKVFRAETVLFKEDDYAWFEMKPYDKRYES
jgi:hypothetical protein